MVTNFSDEEIKRDPQLHFSGEGVSFAKVKVYNPLGRLVAEGKETIKDLPAGIYLMEILTKENRRVKKVLWLR
ncbi:MAG: T9SS type A sorting domain-containing protein [candidate division WOR-3 bacterium]